MHHKFVITALLSLLAWTSIQAQEFNVQVRVQATDIQSSDRDIFTNMQTALTEFVNQRAWTNTEYESHERISGSFVFNISSFDANTGAMTGNLQVQFSRPVYMSNYQSPIFVHMDGDISIKYVENQIIDFNPGRFDDQLSSIIAFYCYVALGLDAHSFHKTQSDHLAMAQMIVSNAQSLGGGWDRFSGQNNRFWIIENLLNPANADFLAAWYEYHRQGMDRMYSPANHRAAKESISHAILKLKPIWDRQPNNSLLRWFFDTKSAEIQMIFSDGPKYHPADLIEALSTMDAANQDKYRKMAS